jgi:drug/metabolite transporter superfamily protein YnfA
MWKIYLFEFIVVVIVSILWVRGIDKMNSDHHDYDGNDFLN